MSISILQFLDRMGEIIKQETFSFFTAIEYINLLRTDSYFFDGVPENAEYIRLVNEDGAIKMYWIHPMFGVNGTNLWSIRDWVN